MESEVNLDEDDQDDHRLNIDETVEQNITMDDNDEQSSDDDQVRIEGSSYRLFTSSALMPIPRHRADFFVRSFLINAYLSNDHLVLTRTANGRRFSVELAAMSDSKQIEIDFLLPSLLTGRRIRLDSYSFNFCYNNRILDFDLNFILWLKLTLVLP